VSPIPGSAVNSSFVAEFKSRSFAFVVDAAGVFDGALFGVCPIVALASANSAQTIQPKNATLRFISDLLVGLGCDIEVQTHPNFSGAVRLNQPMTVLILSLLTQDDSS
jgi:hypothetical protein